MRCIYCQAEQLEDGTKITEPTEEMVEALATGISQVLSRYDDEGCDLQVPVFYAEWYEGFRNGLRAALAVAPKEKS